MSLIPYKDGSVIVDDPLSNSLIILNSVEKTVSIFEHIEDDFRTSSEYSLVPGRQYDGLLAHKNIAGIDSNGESDYKSDRRRSISTYLCPHCGSEINLAPRLKYKTTPFMQDTKSANASNDSGFGRFPTRYFQVLQNNHRYYALQDGSQTTTHNFEEFNIPSELFIPGYFHKFFKIESLLGTGARGSVYKVTHKIGNTNLGVFAVKKIPIGNDMDWFNKCIREVKALSSLTHGSPNLITYNHVWLEMDESVGFIKTFDGEDGYLDQKIPCIFILQQYCSGGNLEEYILKHVFKKDIDLASIAEQKKSFRERRRHENLNEPLGFDTLDLLSILRDISTGLHELHLLGILHRDLKPSNCLITQTLIDDDRHGSGRFKGKIVIGDLGECQNVGEQRAGTGCTGTLEYTAPEIIINSRQDSLEGGGDYLEFSYESDIYSLGMICYFMVFGELPFRPDQELRELRENIKQVKLRSSDMREKHQKLGFKPIHPLIFTLMESMLAPNYKKRPSAKEVIEKLNHIYMEVVSHVGGESLEDGKSILREKSTALPRGQYDELVESEASDEELQIYPRLIENTTSRVEHHRLQSKSKENHLSTQIYNMVALIIIAYSIKTTDGLHYLKYTMLVLFGSLLNSNRENKPYFMAGLMLLFVIFCAHKFNK